MAGRQSRETAATDLHNEMVLVALGHGLYVSGAAVAIAQRCRVTDQVVVAHLKYNCLRDRMPAVIMNACTTVMR